MAGDHQGLGLALLERVDDRPLGAVWHRLGVAELSKQRLLAVVEASDAVVSEVGDSEDPVVVRRVAQALARKASALRELDRVEQAVEVWDELITRQKM